MYCALVGAQVVCVLTEGVMPNKVEIVFPECGHGHIKMLFNGTLSGNTLVGPTTVAKTISAIIKAGKRLAKGGEPVIQVFNCQQCVSSGKPSGMRLYVPPAPRSQLSSPPANRLESGYYSRPPVSERPRRPHYLHRP